MPQVARAQTWNDARSRALVELATARRAEQLADTALLDYRADAHGYVTFLAQIGEGFPEPPKIVKADELALEVYWRAPDLSKQRIVGRRDTLLLPTDIAYHRDHLGIVQNNFPDIIRLGEGDEVRDVPHPLSPAGLRDYDFAISDSERIAFAGHVIHLYQVKVRPKDDRDARVVGAMFIDRDGGQVVRMAFNFTHAAFLDRQLEDVSIVLENGLVGTRFWLPRRQEIEIRRTGTWLEYPIRGLIRGRWEIGNYRINAGLPVQLFSGSEIVQVPKAEQERYPWHGRILDSLPADVRAVTDADVQRVQAEARALVRAAALRRSGSLSLSARGLSDFVRVDRVEGLALGTGIAQPLGRGFELHARGQYGVDDGKGRGGVDVGWDGGQGEGFAVFARDDFADAGDVQEVSTLRNSIAAQEFGADYTDPFRIRAAGLSATASPWFALRGRLALDFETREPLAIHATPASGRYGPTLRADPVYGPRLSVELDRPTTLTLSSIEVQAKARASLFFAAPTRGYAGVACPVGSSLSACSIPAWRFEGEAQHRTAITRLSVDFAAEKPMGEHRVVARTVAAMVRGSDGLTAEDLVFFGGPLSGSGYGYHEIVGTGGFSQRLEWQTPVSFFPVSLGRFGRAPARAIVAPFCQVIGIRGLDGSATSQRFIRGPVGQDRPSGFYPAVGVGLLSFFDVLRLDVARGLRAGRWTFSVDLTRDLWGML